MLNYKMDIGAYQTHATGKDRTKENKQNIGSDPGGGKPTDVIVQGRRRGSYTTGSSVSRQRVVV
jgi:hypothetical protein